MDLLQEQFLNFQLKTALSAVGLKSMKVGNVGDSPIYTDSSTKDIFIEEIQSQDTLKPIINDITRLIESDRIIPVVVKTGILNKIKFFVLTGSQSRVAVPLAETLHMCELLLLLLLQSPRRGWGRAPRHTHGYV